MVRTCYKFIIAALPKLKILEILLLFKTVAFLKHLKRLHESYIWLQKLISDFDRDMFPEEKKVEPVTRLSKFIYLYRFHDKCS